MDKRQLKTRAAIFNAFTELIEYKNFNAITIQDIIDKAMIGRSTFYSHFETKEDMVDALCLELFDHIISSEMNEGKSHSYFNCNPTYSSTCHILHHLLENDHNILKLLSCVDNHIFRRYFKREMVRLVRSQLNESKHDYPIPEEVLVNHVAGTFVEMVMWWLKGDRKETPEELDGYFHAVIDPILNIK